MRKLEALLLASLWVAVFILFSGPNNNNNNEELGLYSLAPWVAINIALLVAHLILEGDVWMMVPAYTSILFVVLAYFIPVMWLHVIISVIVGLCTLFGTIMTIVLPVPTLPPLPTHGHPVATITDCWTKTTYTRTWHTPKNSRGDLEHLRLFLKMWYPADGTHPSYKKGKRAPYLVIKGDAIYETSNVVTHMGPNPFGQFDLPDKVAKLTSSHFVRRTNTNSIYGAKISNAQAKWPVVIYCHGQFGIPEKNTGLIERLVSKGYVVVAYYSDDGSSKWPGPLFRRQHLLRYLLERLVEINTNENIEVGIELSSADLEADKMVKMKGPNPFVGKLDLERGVGLLGHSFGATTAMLMCCRTPQNVFKSHFQKGTKRKLKELKRERMREYQEKKKKELAKKGEQDKNQTGAEKEGKEKEKEKETKKEKEEQKEQSNNNNKDNEKEKGGEEGKTKEKEGEKDDFEEPAIKIPKIRCAIAMDTWMHPVWSNSPGHPRLIKKPLLCINSDLWLSEQNGLQSFKESYEIVRPGTPFYVVTMKGTSHQNFTDYCWLLAAHLPYQAILLPRTFIREQPDGMWHFGPSNPFRVWFNVDNILELFYEKHLLAPVVPPLVSPRLLRRREDEPLALSEKERRALLLDLPIDDSAYNFEVCYQDKNK